MNNKRSTFDYKWIIVILCFLMIFTCLGFCSSNKGLYVSAITEALGIKRSLYSINDSCRYVATAVVNLFFGTLVSRYGTKKLIAAGFLCLFLSSLTYSYANNIFAFYVGGCLLGIGLSWTTTTMVGCVVNKWCKENRGTIMGIILASNGIGGALAAQIISPLIYEEGNAFGYRNAYLLTTGLIAVVGVLILIFFRESPKGHVDEGPVVQKKKARGTGWVGMEYNEAKKKPYFYAAAVCIFLTGMVLQGTSGISAAHYKDVGVDTDYIATVVSVSSLVLTVSKFMAGFLYDRFGLRVTVTICAFASVLETAMIAFVSSSPTGMALAMIRGILGSIALPLETIMLPIYASDFFGEKSYNKILGLFVSINTAGYALGTPIVNVCFDKIVRTAEFFRDSFA